MSKKFLLLMTAGMVAGMFARKFARRSRGYRVIVNGTVVNAKVMNREQLRGLFRQDSPECEWIS